MRLVVVRLVGIFTPPKRYVYVGCRLGAGVHTTQKHSMNEAVASTCQIYLAFPDGVLSGTQVHLGRLGFSQDMLIIVDYCQTFRAIPSGFRLQRCNRHPVASA